MDIRSTKARLLTRVALYGGGAAAAAVLAWLGWFHVPEPGLDTRLEAVFAASRTKEYGRARAELARIADDHPRHVKVLLTRGYLNEAEGDLDAARRAYLEAAAIVDAPDQRREILASVADIERRQGNRLAAVDLLDRIVKEAGESARTRQLRINLLLDDGRNAEALSEAALLAEEDPGNPHAFRLCRELSSPAQGVPSAGSASPAGSPAVR